jgi:hypothetical protein
VSWLGAGRHGGTNNVQSAGHRPETTGRHRRIETPSVLTETGRHRAIESRPEPAEPARRRHAASDEPRAQAPARPQRAGRSRAPQRLLAGTTLLAIALAPVLARSSSGLGLNDAVAAELAAHPDQAEDTLEALGRGGLLAGSITPTPTPTPGSVTSDNPLASSTTSTPSEHSDAGGPVSGSAGSAPSDTANTSATSSAESPSSSTPTDTPASVTGPSGAPDRTSIPTTGDSETRPGDDADELTPTGSARPYSTTSEPTPSEPEPSDENTGAPNTSAPATPTTGAPETTGNLVDTLIDTLLPGAGG